MNWIAQHFLNPSLVVAGAMLVSLPFIIHLINRLRYRRVRFAAMEFLLASEERNRRRVLLEQLLLLLLRAFIVAALVALIARFIVDPAELSLFQGTEIHHVVLLDDTASMQDRSADTTAFDDAVDIVRRLITEGAARPNSQKLTLLLVSRPEQPVIVERPINKTMRSELKMQLRNLRCSSRAARVSGALEAALRLLRDDRTVSRHLHVITDFRERDWIEDKSVGAVVDELAETGIDVNIVRTVSDTHNNVGITSLSGETQVAASGVPVRFRVGVRNFGSQAATDVRLAVDVDGRRLPLSVAFDRIEPGQEVFQERDLPFESRGLHRISVNLDPDALAPDNERHLALYVADSVPVLIVDGSESGATGIRVSGALASDPALTGFAPVMTTPARLRNRSLDEFRSICLINVSQLPYDVVQNLQYYVMAGGGLIWFVGSQVNTDWYNETLYESSGRGLFPVPLAVAPAELSRVDATLAGPDLVFADHPVFSILQGQDNPFIDSVRIDKYLRVADEYVDDETTMTWNSDDNVRRDGVRTVAWLRNREPLVFEHRFGERGGRIVTFLTSAGPEWNNWSLNPSYVVVQLELQKHVIRRDRDPVVKTVGEPISIQFSAADYTGTVDVISPVAAGGRRTRLNASPDFEGGEDQYSVVYRDTDAVGVYRVQQELHEQKSSEQWIAFNVSPTESELALAETSDVLSQFRDPDAVRILAPGSFSWIQSREAGQDVRRLLLILLVVALCAEQLLAWRLSYHSAPAGAIA